MTALFCRRLRMEIDLRNCAAELPAWPDGYRCVEWSPELLERHAAVKCRSFRREIDGRIFESLRHKSGCEHLMRYITDHPQFVSGATWLAIHESPGSTVPEDCGTIQGLSPTPAWGAIQNVGVVGEHRGRGLGRAIVQQALLGFREFGLSHVALEVTAENQPAIALYQALGFRITKTLFRQIEDPLCVLL